MAEIAALAAGCGAVLAVLIAGEDSVPGVRWHAIAALVAKVAGLEDAAAARLAWPWLDGRRLLLAEATAALLGAAVGWALTGLPVLSAAGAALCLGGVRVSLSMRARGLRRARQDAVVEAVRSLRQLLETGAVSVAGALEVLAERGPAILRGEFSRVSRAAGGDQPGLAWAAAREAVAEPVFDLLSAAVLVQRPAGGELAPLFIDLEASVTAVYEVEREAEALQVQARSAAALILALPLAFLALMSALRSPYLDPYRQPLGEIFLAGMLAVMGSSYAWILHWLRLPSEPRLRLRDG